MLFYLQELLVVTGWVKWSFIVLNIVILRKKAKTNTNHVNCTYNIDGLFVLDCTEHGV